MDFDRDDGTIGPVLQGMTANASGGPRAHAGYACDEWAEASIASSSTRPIRPPPRLPPPRPRRYGGVGGERANAVPVDRAAGGLHD
jgi:hypothetical protein